MKRLRRSAEATDRAVLQPLAAIAMLVMMFAIAGNAISRALFNIPLGWSHNLVVEFAMPAVVFVGLVTLTLSDGHVRMEALWEKLGRRSQTILRIIGWLAALAFFIPTAVANVQAAYERRNDAPLQEFSIPAMYQHGLVALCCLLTSLILIGFLVRPRPSFASKRDEADFNSDV